MRRQKQVDLHNGAGKHARQASEKHHLPYGCAKAKETRGNGHATQGGDKYGLPAYPIRGSTPGNHKQHLDERK